MVGVRLVGFESYMHPVKTSAGSHIFLLWLIFASASMLDSMNAAEPAAPPFPTDNPLREESSLPFHFPRFDRIHDEHFLPAIEAGMSEQLAEVATIADEKGKPTFANTIVAMERSGGLLRRAQRTFSNLNAANTNPTLQQIETELAPQLSAHMDAIYLNGKLFARVEELYNSRDKLDLDPESSYLLALL